jgi:hypothetical protein
MQLPLRKQPAVPNICRLPVRRATLYIESESGLVGGVVGYPRRLETLSRRNDRKQSQDDQQIQNWFSPECRFRGFWQR